jgi:acyl-CoA synthetase (AMP-forming)/AMP-acid ligase II
MLGEAARSRGTRLPGLGSLCYGGAPMPGPILERGRERLAASLIATYGMTETSGLLTSADPRDLGMPKESGNVGREGPLIQLEILGADDKPVGTGEVGEIVVTSPAVMIGYRGLKQQTEEVLSGHTLRTGDVARRDRDGTIVLVDRKKDMIISGGENVYSREVELVLERHPAIADVAVVGQPDPRWGEAVCAMVRLKPGSAVSLEELRAFARASLAGYKLPRSMLVLEDMPRTASGKISKGELRSLAAAKATAKTA